MTPRSRFAGFGDEVALMRKYLALAKDGASWLVVFAPEQHRTCAWPTS